MAKNLEETGVIRVNGAWATSVKYSSAALGPKSHLIELQFMQGRSQIARVTLSRDQMLELLGERNAGAIERHLANDADKYLAIVKGELRGERLHYREVSVQANQATAEENTLRPTPAPERLTAQTAEPTSSSDAPASKQASSEPEPPTAREATEEAPSPNKPKTLSTEVPAAVSAKYLIKGNAYHFDDQTVAFVDQGSQLTARTQNKAIIEDLVAIAKAREWALVTVSGSTEFRREAWKIATAAGLTVNGYTPSRLEQLAAERQRPTGEGPESGAAVPPSPPPSPRSGPAAASSRADRPKTPPADDVAVGELVAHAEAPYRNDPAQSPSYFVTLRDAAGRERTLWGVGLKQAVRDAETAPAVGDTIGIRRSGATPVTVIQRTFDEHGEIVAQVLPVKRQQWQIEKAKDFERSPAAQTRDIPLESRPGAITRDQEVAAAIRSAATTREELQFKYPELNKAVFQYLDAHQRFADAYVQVGLIRESDRAQVITQMRERLAKRIERGDYPEPTAKEVDALIIKTVHRAAETIGRAPVDIKPKVVEESLRRLEPVREDVQVRA